MAKSRRRNIIMVVGSVLLIILLTCGGLVYFVGSAVLDDYDNRWKGTGSFDDPVRFSQTQQMGDAIIEALQQYHEVHGRYPGRLDQLVPAYLNVVPQPTAGYGEWDYGGNSEGFYLGFGVGRHCYPCCYRSAETSEWHVDA